MKTIHDREYQHKIPVLLKEQPHEYNFPSSDNTNSQNSGRNIYVGGSQEDKKTVSPKEKELNKREPKILPCRYCEHKVHKCRFCGKSFGFSHDRNVHEMTVHLKEKPHKCRFCVKSFGRIGHRNIHEKTVHLKEKPHKCQFCDKTFGTNSIRDVHEKTVHLKEKPYACRFCGKAFGQSSCRNVHEKKFHRQSTLTDPTVRSNSHPIASVSASSTASHAASSS